MEAVHGGMEEIDGVHGAFHSRVKGPKGVTHYEVKGVSQDKVSGRGRETKE